MVIYNGRFYNQYLDFTSHDKTYTLIQKFFAEQNVWGSNRLTDIPHIATEYGLTLQASNREQAHRVTKEIKAVGVEKIPTVFVGETAFVETVDLEAFKAAVEKHS